MRTVLLKKRSAVAGAARRRQPPVRGWGRMDVIGSVSVIILLFMFLPQLLQLRQESRSRHCSNNLRQLGLSLQNFESARQKFPAATGFISGRRKSVMSDRLSGFVAILPYLECGPQYEMILAALEEQRAGETFDVIFEKEEADLWQTPPQFRCPDFGDLSRPMSTNYAFCIGDQSVGLHQPGRVRGAFTFGRGVKIREISDGTAQTLLLAEVCSRGERRLGNANVAQGLPQSYLGAPLAIAPQLVDGGTHPSFLSRYSLEPLGRGGRAYDGAASYTLFQTILPPNSPSFHTGDGPASDGLFSASSYHGDGVPVCFADGSTSYISADIDCGTAGPVTPVSGQASSDEIQNAASMPSPYGVWGAMGTINGSEAISEDAF